MRKALLLLAVGLVGLLISVVVVDDTPAAPKGGVGTAWFRLDAIVTRVIDGDTLRATVDARSETVRLVGINAPEVGACGAAQATAHVRRLTTQAARVVLVGDRSQARRDRYGRLLAYVVLSGGSDLGNRLIADGHAAVYVYGGKPFARAAAYRAAEATAKAQGRGKWAVCGGATPTSTTVVPATPPVVPPVTPPVVTPPTTVAPPATTTVPPATACDGSYPDFCIPPPPPDLDCKNISRKGFRVLQPDPHRFDGDKDGVGCES